MSEDEEGEDEEHIEVVQKCYSVKKLLLCPFNVKGKNEAKKNKKSPGFVCTHKYQLKCSVCSKARVILNPIRGFKAYPGNLAVRDTIPLSPLQADKIPSLQDSRCGKQWLVYW